MVSAVLHAQSERKLSAVLARRRSLAGINFSSLRAADEYANQWLGFLSQRRVVWNTYC